MTLADIVPHRGRMLLLDRIDSYDAEKSLLTASFVVREGNVFYDADIGGLPSWASVEIMAQAAAACAGAHDLARPAGSHPKPGLLLGSRRVLMPRAVYRLGERYTVTSAEVFSDEESGAFSCEIRDGSGALAASCTLAAYRPPDFSGFIAAAR